MSAVKRPGIFPARIEPADSAPPGAKVLSVLHVLSVPILGFFAMNAVLYSLLPAWTGGDAGAPLLYVTGGSILLIALAVAVAATAYGLWVVEPWAWVLSLSLYVLSIPASLLQSEVVPAAIAVCVLLYLAAVADFYGFDVG